MRDIKFRAWHDQQNEWWYFTLDELVDAGNKNEIQKHGAFLKHRTLFTGLLDKNEKEIYEGDILQDLISGVKWTVVFGFNKKYAFTGWYVENKEIGRTPTLNGDYGGDKNPHVEIIGNIYQNPELLNPST